MQDAGLKRVYEDALEYGRRILAADPFREKIQCAVMWLYVLSGQRAHALRQYRDYEALLDHELDIRPMPETRALHAHIISDVERGLEPRDDAGRQASDQNGSELCGRPFDSVLSEIEQSRRKIFQTLVVQSN